MSIIYECSSCGEEYSFWDGVGYHFPSYFGGVQQDAFNGKYGREIQQLIAENPETVVDASYKIYLCENCGFWKESASLDCYVPKNKGARTATLERAKSKAAEMGIPDEFAYMFLNPVAPWDLKSCYTLQKAFRHACPNCNTEMAKYEEPLVAGKRKGKAVLKLKCRKCGSEIVETDREILID